MSDIFWTDASEAPVPPDEVRIRQFSAAPRRDGTRIDVAAELTPFQKRPNLEVSIHNAAGNEVAALSVVEAIDPKMDFTMHLRETKTGGSYRVAILVFYADVEQQQAANGSATSAGEILHKARHIVDQREVSFEIPAGN
jgi:hypothetical protein